MCFYPAGDFVVHPGFLSEIYVKPYMPFERERRSESLLHLVKSKLRKYNPGRGDTRPGFHIPKPIVMKNVFKTIATIVCLLAIVFLAGEWPEDTPRRKVVTYDTAALATALVCGIYLRASETNRDKRPD